MQVKDSLQLFKRKLEKRVALFYATFKYNFHCMISFYLINYEILFSFCLKQLNKGTFKEQGDKPYCHDCFDRLFG